MKRKEGAEGDFFITNLLWQENAEGRGVPWPILPPSLIPAPLRDHPGQAVADTGQAGRLGVLCVSISRAEAWTPSGPSTLFPAPPLRVLSAYLTPCWGHCPLRKRSGRLHTYTPVHIRICTHIYLCVYACVHIYGHSYPLPLHAQGPDQSGSQ